MKKNFIYGRKPVLEALQNRADEVEKIFLKNTVSVSSIQNIKDLADSNLIPISKVPQVKIQHLVGRVNDQGIVALISPIKYVDFFKWVEETDLRENPAVLLLDGTEDPHNFGAILRTAAAAGISAVLVPSQGQSPVTPVVFKTSAGTAGRIPLIRVHDANQGIKDLQLAGFEIYALDGHAETTIWDAEFKKPTAFLIGNEGAGLDKKLLQKVNGTLLIPMNNKVESLNASVSAALVCYEWKRKRSII